MDKLIDLEETVSFQYLEQFVGRLMFCASVTRIPLVSFYFTLKWVRRLFSRFNRGEIDFESPIPVPASILSSFKTFKKRATTALYIRDKPTARCTLITDASLDGWGAVLIDQFNRIRVHGARWSEDEKSFHINVLEALAVEKALNFFDFDDGVELTIIVDNTSVEHALKKGKTKSDDLAPIIDRCATKLQRHFARVKVGYIKSKYNPADFYSRNFAPMETQTSAQGGAGFSLSNCVNIHDTRY